MLPMALPVRSQSGSSATAISPSLVLARDEATLVARIRVGDESAFEELFHAYYDALCAFAVGFVASPHVAEELVHDVLLRIWERREQWEVREELRCYLYRAVRNRALNALKRAQVAARWQEAAALDSSIAGIGQAPAHADEVARTHDLVSALDRALQQLPERQRQAYLLRWQHELPYSAIASIMGVAEKTVESTLTRATKGLRKALDAFF